MTDIFHDSLILVGEYKPEFNSILQREIPCLKIYQSSGLKIHIKKSHSNVLQYLENIPEIILFPDFIGCHPKEDNSVEFVKCYEKNILLAVKLDMGKNYLYVASLYDVTDSKIQNRLNSGRLKKVN